MNIRTDLLSGIRDNHSRGRVADFLAEKAASGSRLFAPKQVLEVFRALCQGQSAPHAALCKLFDAETRNGQDMQRYSGLLEKAVAAIAAQLGRKNAGNLFAGRGGKLVGAQGAVNAATDFDLITWLVIKRPPALQGSKT